MTHARPTTRELINGSAIVPPDELYRAALWLVQNGKSPWPGALPELQQAWKYLRRQRGLASVAQATEEDPDIARAFAIARSSAASHLVRGLVLADMDAAEIARCADASKEAVALFARMFWNVRPRLRAPGYIYAAIQSLELEQQETLNLELAYAHGQDTFLEALGVAKLKPATSALVQELCAKRARLRALAAMQRPIQSAQDATRAVKTYLQLRRQEMTEGRERHRLEQVQRQVETAAVNLDKNARTQRTNLKAERRRLEELAAQLARRQQALAEREAECARMMAEAQQVVRENEKPAVATPALAALREDLSATGRRPRVHVG